MRLQVKTTDVNEDSMNQKPKFSIVFFEVNVNPLSANPTKWSNTVKQFVGNLSNWRLKGSGLYIRRRTL